MIVKDTDFDLGAIAAPSTTWDRNLKKRERGGHGRCVVCGAPINRLNSAKAVHVVQGGNHIALAGEPFRDDGSDLATYYVGPECYKRHRDALTPYVEPTGIVEGTSS
ncbi:MAG: hypothetical protein M3440_06450 [Chloroflexota bacterium]|nr:hypothetical protein [Chloroflexota bacterium]